MPLITGSSHPAPCSYLHTSTSSHLLTSTLRSILMRKVRAWRLDNLELSGADCFMLDMLADNLPHPVMDQVSTSSMVAIAIMPIIMAFTRC